MKLLKFSSILLCSFIFMGLCIPQLSAKHHRSKSYRSTSFSINFNVDRPAYYPPVAYVTPIPTPAPAYVERTIIQPVQPTAPIIQERVYYPYPCYRQVIVERPYVERVSVHPQFSFYSSWGWRR